MCLLMLTEYGYIYKIAIITPCIKLLKLYYENNKLIEKLELTLVLPDSLIILNVMLYLKYSISQDTVYHIITL